MANANLVEEGADGVHDDAQTHAAVTGREAKRQLRLLKKKRKRLKRALVVALAIGPVTLLSRLPLPMARFFGQTAGLLVYAFAHRERRIALDNLRHAFPDLDHAQIRRLCRRNFSHASVAIAESMVIRRWSVEKIDRHFGLRADFRSFQREYLAEDGNEQGVVGIAAHYGNWELLAVMFARYLPGTMVPVANRNSNEFLQQYLEKFRERLGLDVFYTDESPRRLFKILRERKALGFLPDQDLKTPNGVFVNFFGRPAYTTTIPVNLAKSAKTEMTLGCLVREGKRYRFVYHTVPLTWTGDRALDLRSNTQRWTTILEEEIRTRPEQWIWFHQRWRTQPGDEQRRQRVRWTQKTRQKSRKESSE